MRTLSIVAVVAACGGSGEPPPAPKPAPVARTWSEALFEPNVRAVLANAYPGATLTSVDVDAYRIVRHPDVNLEVRFAKAHDQCRDAWSACEDAVEHVIRALAQSAHPHDVEVAQLRVVLRATGKIDEVRRRTFRVYTRPFSSDAQWILAADSRDMIQLGVTPELVKLSPDDAWRTAVAASKPSDVATAEAGSFLVYQSDYAPSALLFPEVLEAAVRAKHPDLKGHLLAVSPEENILLYTIGGPAEVANLRSGAASGMKNSKMPLSTAVMEWRDGSWHELP